MNAEMYPKFLPDWIPRFYCDRESVPHNTIYGLIERDAEVILYSRSEYPNGMFPRFLIADDSEVERFLVRDVDSRPSQREVNAVNAWIASGKDFHAMRDHPYHAVLMLGGLWGAKGGVLKNVEPSIKVFPRSRHPYSREHQYGADQQWLWQEVWPKFQRSGIVHDSCLRGQFPLGIDFPDPLVEGDFVGSVYNSEDQPNAEHVKVRNEFIRSQKSA